ncbi:MAG: hypothetical protein ACI9BW_000419, partial [Gammaproteobacteria bacterium]
LVKSICWLGVGAAELAKAGAVGFGVRHPHSPITTEAAKYLPNLILQYASGRAYPTLP